MSDNDAVLLEDRNHKFDVILEYLVPLVPVPRKLDEIDRRLKTVESDVKVIKVAIKHQAKDHKKLERRVTKLEVT